MTKLEQGEVQRNIEILKFYNDLQLDVIRDLYELPAEAEIPTEAFMGWSFDRDEIYAKTFRRIIDNLIKSNDPILAFGEQNIAIHIKDEMLKLYPELNHSRPH